MCSSCHAHQNNPPCAPLHPWVWPKKLWERKHIDYAGPLLGKMFLIIQDAHSKWMDVYPMNKTTSSGTIDKLWQSFSNQGIPHVIVPDNQPQFTSDELKSL